MSTQAIFLSTRAIVIASFVSILAFPGALYIFPERFCPIAVETISAENSCAKPPAVKRNKKNIKKENNFTVYFINFNLLDEITLFYLK
jgi:hypothetical protein